MQHPNAPATPETAHSAPPPAMDRSSPPLSPTERKVFALLRQRMTEREVADTLDRSHNTVHVHVRNIYRKLGLRTRQQLLDLPDPPDTGPAPGSDFRGASGGVSGGAARQDANPTD